MKRLHRVSLLLVPTALVMLLSGPAAGQKSESPPWVEPMKKVRARFTGAPGTFAQFGDSITISMAFWAPLRSEPKNMPEAMAKAHKLVNAHMNPDCWTKWRGPGFGSNGGMTIRWAHDNLDKWLKAHNPEVAVIMFGTNDLFQLEVKELEAKTADVVERCLKNGTVVLLTTLPPCSGRVEKSKEFAEAVRRVAKKHMVPLIDYHAEVLKRRPDDWDGTLAKFNEFKDVYEVPTLISRDGVHPSNPKAHQDFSDKSLNKNGYLLRNYMTLLAYADVIRHVLPKKKAALQAPKFPFDAETATHEPRMLMRSPARHVVVNSAVARTPARAILVPRR